MTASPLQLPTRRERWEARIKTLENTVRERDQLITELEAQLRLREAEIETLAEVTVTELDLTDAIHDIAHALGLQATDSVHPLDLAQTCRAAALELRQAIEPGKEKQQ